MRKLVIATLVSIFCTFGVAAYAEEVYGAGAEPSECPFVEEGMVNTISEATATQMAKDYLEDNFPEYVVTEVEPVNKHNITIYIITAGNGADEMVFYVTYRGVMMPH